jgi:hypothetical protein
MRRARRDRRSRRLLAVAAIGSTALAVAVIGVVPALSSAAHPSKDIDEVTFKLFPNTAVLACAQAEGQKAKVKATVERGNLNDEMTLKLSGFQPGLNFDLFTVQNSNQNADGSPVEGFTNFGLAWYQSDIHVHGDGTGKVTIDTILLDQIFGFDPAVSLDPTNTFHVGFWFNDPKDAADCGFQGSTPFNGEHNAGPLAFITRPDATFNLGPLCTKPKSVGVCKL